MFKYFSLYSMISIFLCNAQIHVDQSSYNTFPSKSSETKKHEMQLDSESLSQSSAMQESKSQNNSSNNDKNTNDENTQECDEETIELEEVFESSPKAAQIIVDHLKDPRFLNDGSFRYCIFVGPPGSGKTTMAKAIVYKLNKEGWNSEFIESGEIIGDKRNQAAVRLRTLLHQAIEHKKPTIVVIDELNELLEHTESEHHDTSATAKFLWLFLDAQKNNNDFFLIGTMNRDTNLPQPLKSRILLKRVRFEQLSENKMREMFFKKLARSKIELDTEISKDYLFGQLQRLSTCSARDMTELISKWKQLSRIEDPKNEKIIIKKHHIEQGISELLHNLQEIEYDKVEETDAQRQERHFVQKQIIEDLIRKKQKTEYSYYGDNHVRSTQLVIDPQDEEEIYGSFSDEQKKIIRETQERGRKAKAENDRKRREIWAKQKEIAKEKENEERKNSLIFFKLFGHTFKFWTNKPKE